MIMKVSPSLSEMYSLFYFKPQILEQGIYILLNKKESNCKEEQKNGKCSITASPHITYASRQLVALSVWQNPSQPFFFSWFSLWGFFLFKRRKKEACSLHFKKSIRNLFYLSFRLQDQQTPLTIISYEY